MTQRVHGFHDSHTSCRCGLPPSWSSLLLPEEAWSSMRELLWPCDARPCFQSLLLPIWASYFRPSRWSKQELESVMPSPPCLPEFLFISTQPELSFSIGTQHFWFFFDLVHSSLQSYTWILFFLLIHRHHHSFFMATSSSSSAHSQSIL